MSVSGVRPNVSVSDGYLDNSVALVTGASSGIGEAIADALAAEGADVALTTRREGELEAVSDRLRTEYGVETAAIPTDVTADAQVEAVVDETVDALEPEDVADTVRYAVTLPDRVAIDELLVRPCDREL